MNQHLEFETAGRTLQPQARVKDLKFGASLDWQDGFQSALPTTEKRSFQSMLHQYEVIMSYGTIDDPRVILQTMNLYMMANQQNHGIALFAGILTQYGHGMAPELRAVYESALGVLRATHADAVPLSRRIGWVKESFELIETALRRTGGSHPIPHWAAGMVYAQVPWFFFKKAEAKQHLTWLSDRPDTEPTFGFYREVYRQLSNLETKAGNAEAATAWMQLSGYDGPQPHAPLMGWFATGPDGTTMAPRPVIDEVISGRIFALYGFGFSDVYFVLSDDGAHLIAIDAGTQPHSLQAAHEFLLAAYPSLPDISTAFITHSHWDHIGGHSYLQRHNPEIDIYGRSNFASVQDRVMREHSYQFFRGADFDHAWVKSYAPTHPVSDPMVVNVGGTDMSLLPVTGGETEDAMLIHIPKLSCVFVGDVVMPWYGEPWVNEGFASTAPQAMDAVLDLGAKHILHGHHPLTFLYGPQNLRAYKGLHEWLVSATQFYVRRGYSAKDIIRLNLIPPALLDHPDVTMGYVAARDNVISRVAAEMAGIWREDRTGQAPEGLDVITTAERARMLSEYFNLSEAQAIRGLKRMIAAGDNSLALQMSVAAEHAFGPTSGVTLAKENAADRLRSIAQFTDPFGFTTYSEMTKRAHPPMPAVTGQERKQIQ